VSYAVPSLNAPLDLDFVLVIIPVLNEQDAIADVIQHLRLQRLTHIRVIDNGSTDDSAIVVSKLGVEVIQEEKRGYGQACWRGLQNLPPQIDWILFCDGDGSDDLKQLSQFWVASRTADFILANRRADSVSRSNLTPAQNWGNELATFLIRWGWGYPYQDLGPLRLIRRAALEKIQMQDRAFGWTVEMQVRAIEEHLEIVEIPAPYHHRQGGKSKISGTMQGIIKAGLGILMTIAKLYIRRMLLLFDKEKSL
jgi:glycosyltransferase involved in cell wall biosynthesis